MTMFDGNDLPAKTAASALLSTVDADGWPHLSFLSAGEVLIDGDRLALTLWAKATTAQALEARRQGVLFVAEGGVVIERRFTVDAVEVADDAPFALIRATFGTVRTHKAPYAEVTALIGFELHDPTVTVARWETQVARMRAALASS